jgi:hypothetical protein
MSRSTINSTINGKAYEYACILVLKKLIDGHRPFEIIENQSLTIARDRYFFLDKREQENMIISARAGINVILELEPRILSESNDLLTLQLQSDDNGKKGDVRDVLIIRKKLDWQIGISVKHNHNALRHSRLSESLDFGEQWLNMPCSAIYFETIKPIFALLNKYKKLNYNWAELENKTEEIYVPLLKAFISELKMKFNINQKETAENITKYLFGIKDFYKLISNDNRKTTRLIACNYGCLNADLLDKNNAIPLIVLPDELVRLEFKRDSKTTVELIMNNGWQISFRIHNASTKVEKSLKFDVQLIGMPTDLFYLDIEW